jgi:release factor glutamine methyltransferase
MILKIIQNTFHKELDAIYGANEVDSFFNLLTEYYLGLNRLALALKPNLEINELDEIKFQDALNKLKEELPIQYIIGETEFFGLPFKVNKNTLIPRPETEELVDWVLSQQGLTNNQKPNILDIGTGSGCIAITLAKQLPDAKVYALDVSKKALKTAIQNAELNEVYVTFIEANILDSFDSRLDLNSTFDVIVSNPPYVRYSEREVMANNVLKHEPDLALYVEDDRPLRFYEAIIEFASNNLDKNGMLIFEINQYLGNEMNQLFAKYDFSNISLKKDMFGNDRMIKGIKN